MNKKFFLALLFFSLFPISAAFAAERVPVTLPNFDITINGQSTSNTHSRYPFLVYNDITYFPMTHNDSQLLGIQSHWDSQTGLTVTQSDGYCYEYARSINEIPNAKNLTAQIISTPVTVDGIAIDNATEPYPLLIFRDITYFPITWRFAVDFFGWDYHFDHKQGLVIVNEDVKLEDPDPWNGSIQYSNAGGFGSMAGADELPFPIKAVLQKHTFTLEELKTQQITDITNPARFSMIFYNMTDRDISILPMQQWEYQLYRSINGQQELLYWRKLPFYAGPMAAENVGIGDDYAIPFWHSDELKPGTYHIQIIHPGVIPHTVGDSKEILEFPVKEASSDYGGEDSYVRFFFSETITVIN